MIGASYIRTAMLSCLTAFTLSLVIPMIPELMSILSTSLVELREGEERANGYGTEDVEIEELDFTLLDCRLLFNESGDDGLIIIVDEQLGPFLELDPPPPERA